MQDSHFHTMLVAPPGFEPGPTDPESAVLPLHHGAKLIVQK